MVEVVRADIVGQGQVTFLFHLKNLTSSVVELRFFGRLEPNLELHFGPNQAFWFGLEPSRTEVPISTAVKTKNSKNCLLGPAWLLQPIFAY